MLLTQPIQGHIPTDMRLSNYERLSFYQLAQGCAYSTIDKEAFFADNHVRFRARIGHYYLAGDELLYYPTLTQKLREVSEYVYPWFEQTFSIDSALRGIHFVRHLFNTIETGQAKFLKAKAMIDSIVDDLVAQHGQIRTYPVIDGVERISASACASISVSGVVWRFDASPDTTHNHIDCHTLFNLSKEAYKFVLVEDVKLDTPFIAVRLLIGYKHKGRLIWYNLATREPATKAEMDNWQMPREN